MHQIKVINNNPFEIVDYFDGIAYRFSPKKGVNLSLEAARHIFGVDFPEDAESCKEEGFRAEILLNLQRRWGWNSTKEESVQDARRKFAKIEFLPVMLKMVELVAQVDEPEEPREQKAAHKKSSFKPRADEPVQDTEPKIESEEEVA